MEDEKLISVRVDIDDEKYQEMKMLAKRNHRSLKSQVLVWCIDGFEMEKENA